MLSNENLDLQWKQWINQLYLGLNDSELWQKTNVWVHILYVHILVESLQNSINATIHYTSVSMTMYKQDKGMLENYLKLVNILL